MTDHHHAKRKLAHRLAEAVVRKFPDVERSSYDIDEMRRWFEMEIPDTRAEAEAEMDALCRETAESRKPAASALAELRKAVGAADGDSIITVVRAATAIITQARTRVREWGKTACAADCDATDMPTRVNVSAYQAAAAAYQTCADELSEALSAPGEHQ